MCRTWGSNLGPLACQANTLPIELPRPVPDALGAVAVDPLGEEISKYGNGELLCVICPFSPNDVSMENSEYRNNSEVITLESNGKNHFGPNIHYTSGILLSPGNY